MLQPELYKIMHIQSDTRMQSCCSIIVYVFCISDIIFTVSELRIVLLGKSLQDTSMVGNHILGRVAFETEAPPHSVKRHSERARGYVQGMYITIINAAHLFNPLLDSGLLKPEELKECADLSAPGPHAFLLVIQSHNFTDEDKKQLGLLLNCFSEQALNYAFVIDTDRDSSKGMSGGKKNASQMLIEECCQRYYNYRQLVMNEMLLCMFNQIKTVDKENGGDHLICKSFKDAHEEFFQTNENPARQEVKTLPDLSDYIKEKNKSTLVENISGRMGECLCKD